MKKLLIMLLAGVSMFTFAGCSKREAPVEDSKTNTIIEKTQEEEAKTSYNEEEYTRCISFIKYVYETMDILVGTEATEIIQMDDGKIQGSELMSHLVIECDKMVANVEEAKNTRSINEEFYNNIKEFGRLLHAYDNKYQTASLLNADTMPLKEGYDINNLIQSYFMKVEMSDLIK